MMPAHGPVQVGCVWCSHQVEGSGWEPYESIKAHQVEVHGGRAMRCGCRYARDEGVPARSFWWTCDEHSAVLLRQNTGELFANYHAGRWSRAADAAPPAAASPAPTVQRGEER